MPLTWTHTVVMWICFQVKELVDGTQCVLLWSCLKQIKWNNIFSYLQIQCIVIFKFLNASSMYSIFPWNCRPWWRFDMETLSALLALCGDIHRSPLGSLHKGPVMQCFDVSFNVSLNKLLNKQSRGRLIEMYWRSFDVIIMFLAMISSVPASREPRLETQSSPPELTMAGICQHAPRCTTRLHSLPY